MAKASIKMSWELKKQKQKKGSDAQMYKVVYDDCTKVYKKYTHELLGSFPTEKEADEYIDSN